ncbi:ABC transporter ATP-binding protein/permease [Bosea minatitlanensis]|uniref:ABC transporter ATP-binding protein/permease n=1 Tax=Bosea minatitlanensis TaxID=128782 RepID=A0ABW0F414_9HYPH|nr:ABC transporter ATP-binding protein/permease [Bosea minatitlanensis]MCT4493700.1 ABC transporter ATP-binding protein/permease [Bosea minatitlanensis]
MLDVPASGVLRQLWILIKAMRSSPRRDALLFLPVGSVIVIATNAVFQIRLNNWQGALYDALQNRDIGAFGHQLLVFLMLIAVLLLLVVAQTWLTEVGKVRLRGWLTRDLLDEWLKPKRAYLLAFAGEAGVNPDQRLHEDARHLTELSVDLGNGLLQASLMLLSFIGVLWILSEQVVFNFGHGNVSIPGYMVWCAIAYAAIGSWLAWRVGRPLIALNAERYAREADFRVSLIRVAERSEAIVLYQGESDERRHLDETFHKVQRLARQLASGIVSLTWVTSGHGWLAMAAPFLIASPGYFGGQLSLGSLMIAVGAFNQVQYALRWFVDNFSKIADWRATLLRIMALRDRLQHIEQLHGDQHRITFYETPDGSLILEDVEAYLPGSLVECAAPEDRKIVLKAGEHVLIAGDSAAAKTTMFMSLAGLWPWGDGRIGLPPRAEMLFLPERPYFPIGTLRVALAYPAGPLDHKDEHYAEALRSVGLDRFVEDLDREIDWDRRLSLEEQQTLGFARVFLHAPRWVFLNDSLGAVSEKRRAALMAAFAAKLGQCTIVSTDSDIGHHFFQRTIHLRHARRREAGAGEPIPERD